MLPNICPVPGDDAEQIVAAAAEQCMPGRSGLPGDRPVPGRAYIAVEAPRFGTPLEVGASHKILGMSTHTTDRRR